MSNANGDKLIFIAGMGVAGSYLARRLRDNGFDVECHDPRRSDYYLPCGYATNRNLLRRALERVNMDPDGYIMSEADHVYLSSDRFEIEFGSSGLCTIDKKRMIEDMNSGIEVFPSKLIPEADSMTVDATGISRGLIGKSENDYSMIAKEYLCESGDHDDFYFHYFPEGRGYYWEFPLGNRWHIGAGSSDPKLIDQYLGNRKRILVTGRRIRLRPLFQESVAGNMIAVGEAAGCVSPITGEGIMPSLRSAECLFKAISGYDDIRKIRERYLSCLYSEMGYYYDLFNLLKKSQNGRLRDISNLKNINIVRKDLRDFGIRVSFARLLRNFL